MHTFKDVPKPRFNAQQLADAVPLSLHRLVDFNASLASLPATANQPRNGRWPARAYLATPALPARFRVH